MSHVTQASFKFAVWSQGELWTFDHPPSTSQIRYNRVEFLQGQGFVYVIQVLYQINHILIPLSCIFLTLRNTLSWFVFIFCVRMF